MIEFPCPHCAMMLKVPDDFIGKTSRCFNCKRPVVTPELKPTHTKSHTTEPEPLPLLPLNPSPRLDRLARESQPVVPRRGYSLGRVVGVGFGAFCAGALTAFIAIIVIRPAALVERIETQTVREVPVGPRGGTQTAAASRPVDSGRVEPQTGSGTQSKTPDSPIAKKGDSDTPTPPTKSSSTPTTADLDYNPITITDPTRRVTADDLHTAFMRRHNEAVMKYAGNRYLIQVRPEYYYTLDGTKAPVLLIGTSEGFRKPVVVMRLENTKGAGKREDTNYGHFLVEGEVVGWHKLDAAKWSEHWMKLEKSNYGDDEGYAVIVDRCKIVREPK